MKEYDFYRGFDPLREMDDVVDALVNDPPEVRWRVVRDLFRIKKPEDRHELMEKLGAHMEHVEDFRVKGRIGMAIQALRSSYRVGDYVVVKGKGAFAPSELESDAEPCRAADHPIVDFHIHPKSPDLKFMCDMKEAGVTHAVILSVDTDPSDVDRPEVQEDIRRAYSKSRLSPSVPFERVLHEIRASLYTPTHITNQDVADWVQDYPDILIGFGSVDLSKDRSYVAQKLEEIERLKLRGVKLIPHSQFFNPSENQNMDMLFEFCRSTQSIILSHSGCGPGPFEIPELSHNSHPGLWEPLVKEYPDVPLVFAHFGAYSNHIPGIWLDDVMQMGKEYESVYADLAAVHTLLDVKEVVQKIRATMGFDRVLFATDYPLPLYLEDTLEAVVRSVKQNIILTEKEKEAVLGRNADRLLGLSA